MSAPDRIFCMREWETYLLETPARLHAEELAEALREALEKIEDTKCITGLGFPSFQARAGELLAKLEKEEGK